MGEDITLPTEEASQPEACVVSEAFSQSSDFAGTRKKRASKEDLPRSKRRVPHNLTINVNYVFGSPTSNILNTSTSFLPACVPSVANLNNSISSTAISGGSSILASTINENLNSNVDVLNQSTGSNFADTTAITYNFDLATKTLQPSHHTSTNPDIVQSLSISTPYTKTSVEETSQIPQVTTTPHILCENTATITLEESTSPAQSNICSPRQSHPPSPQIDSTVSILPTVHEPEEDQSTSQSITNTITHTFFDSSNCKQELDVDNKHNIPKANLHRSKKRKNIFVCSYVLKVNKKIAKKAAEYRDKRRIKQRCEDLITAYGLHLETLHIRYQHSPIVQNYFLRFKALELYTSLLKHLKMICNKNASAGSTSSSPSGLKRSRNSHADDDSSPSSQRMARKINRQEENFRHMLLPDTPEETNRKDASKNK